MIYNDTRIDIFTMKLINPPKYHHSHPNLPTVHPLHPGLICVWSTRFPSIWTTYMMVISLLWPNEWYLYLCFSFFHAIHHLATEMHHSCHPVSPKSLLTLNQPFCLKNCHPITYIASQDGHRSVMTIEMICNDFGTDLFTMKHVNPQ